MNLRSERYEIKDPSRLITPALLIYPELVDANITATLKMLGNDPNRWRPHVKTAKLGATIRRLIDRGVQQFKCSTTLELLTACRLGASDVLMAFPVMGANARRVLEIAEQFPRTRVSVLVEAMEQAVLWRNTGIGIFIDVNPGMNRTGVAPSEITNVIALARATGAQFRGLHYYDGHMSAYAPDERKTRAHQGYDELLNMVQALRDAETPVAEVITSGTPAAPFGISYAGFSNAPFVHRVSPGTMVYNDMVSLQQLPSEYNFVPAALVLSTVVSHPLPGRITCDAGHKSVSADAGVPTCSVIGYPDLIPQGPSEEHLPIEITGESHSLRLGSKLYLLPRHVCPTVNNFDQALMIVGGEISGVEPVTARGHESPLALVEHTVSA